MRRLFANESLSAALATAVCVWALYAQQHYRVAAGTPEWVIAWAGVGLGVFSACLTARGWIEEHLGSEQAVRVVDHAATISLWLVGAYALWSLVLFANAFFDGSPALRRQATVAALSRGEAYLAEFIPVVSADLAFPGSSEQPRVLLTRDEAEALWGGEPVDVYTFPGALGLARIGLVTRDEEVRHRAVLAQSPGAAASWAALASLYARREQWPQALDAARGYLHASAQVDPIATIAAERFQRGDYPHALEFSRLVFERDRSFKSTIFLGWTLAKLGRHEEALPLLEEAVRLNPETFWGYYHLAYAYSYAGKRSEAAAMFREVLKRRPNFPEIEQQLRSLGQ